MSGAFDPTAHWTSYLRCYPEVLKRKPGPKRLDPERIREVEARAQHNDHRVHDAHPQPPGPNPAAQGVVAYVR